MTISPGGILVATLMVISSSFIALENTHGRTTETGDQPNLPEHHEEQVIPIDVRQVRFTDIGSPEITSHPYSIANSDTSTRSTSSTSPSLVRRVDFGVGLALAPTRRLSFSADFSVGSDYFYYAGLLATTNVFTEWTSALSVGLGIRQIAIPLVGTVSMGPAFLYGVLDQPANERFYEPGIMARAQSLLLIPDIGFGIDVFGILSKTHRTVGVAFSLAFHNNKYRHGD